MRWATVAAVLMTAGIGYVILVQYFHASEPPVEQQFGATDPGKASVEIYVEPVGIDALNKSMQVRLSVPTSRAPRGEQVAPDRDRVLLITYDKMVQELKISANEPVPTVTIALDLNGGSVADYPLDTYRADLRLLCLSRGPSSSGEAKSLPVAVTVWEAVLGYHLHASQPPSGNPDEVRLVFDFHRSGGFSLFALAAYGAMAVLGCCALAIGVLTFAGVRRPDPPLTGALGAIVFALPALRNGLPGAPPLGVRLDMFVFLWTELAAVIALGLLVTTWARSGPRP